MTHDERSKLPGGPKQPYSDEGDDCDHDYHFDEDAAEYVCVHCGDRHRPDLTELM